MDLYRKNNLIFLKICYLLYVKVSYFVSSGGLLGRPGLWLSRVLYCDLDEIK